MRITFETVRRVGLTLPDVEEGTSYGLPALKVHGTMFACVPAHKSAEPGSLVVRMNLEQRDELLAADPKTYYVKDHYLEYPCVLVRLAHLHSDALKDLLLTARRFVTATTKPRSVARKRKAARRKNPDAT